MSQMKMKLVLRNSRHASASFEIVKAVNTLDYGIPGDKLTRKEVDKILVERPVVRGTLTVEFLDK